MEPTDLGWPYSYGEMAGRIRAHDWSATPLGPVAGWSERLKVLVELVLASPLVSTLAIGPQHLLIYNDAAARHLGDHHPKALGRPLPNAFPQGWATVASYYARAFAGETVRVAGQPLDTRGEGVSTDIFDALLTPMRDSDGRVANVLMTGAEVGDRARIEAALRESDTRHRLLIESWAQAVWEADAHGVIVADSPSWRAYTGQSLEEWLGYGWLNAIHPDDRANAEQEWRKAMAARRLVDAEFRLRAADGGWRWTNVRAAPVLDAQGTIEKWAGMNIDIDARKRAEAALRESEINQRGRLEQEVRDRTSDLKDNRDLLQATMDSSLDMIQVFEAIRDADGEIIDFRWVLNNHTSEVRYGEVRGESLIRRNPGVIPEGIFAAFKRVVETGQPEQAERHYVHEQFDGWFYQSVVKLDDGVATTTKEISGWKAAQADVLRLQNEVAQAKVRESEERLSQFGEASQDVLWIRDAETLQWQYLTPAFETIYGLSRAEALAGNNYRNWMEFILPEDRRHATDAVRRVRTGEHVTFEYRIRRPSDGAIRWLRNTDFPILDASGQVHLIGGVGHDITDAKTIEAALTHSEQRLRTLVEGVAQLVWRAIDNGDWTWASPQWTAFTGQDEPDSHHLGWLKPVHPDDRETALRAWDHALRMGGFEVEYRIRNASTGLYRWFQTRAAPVRDSRGEITEWLGTSTDIHELRELQTRQHVLVAELQHRTRNLMGVVRSTMEATLRSSIDMDDFSRRYRDRIQALARVQGLLSRLEGVERVTFDQLIESELAAIGPINGTLGKVVLDGPPKIALRSSTVQTFALALHELATNALKYGALAQSSGHLAITWRLVYPGRDQGPWLYVDWHESGVAMPPADAAPQGTGQGRQLIERALPYQLGAKTTYVMGPNGVRCSIAVPVSSQTAVEDIGT